MFTKIHGKFMCNTSDSDSFYGQGSYGIKEAEATCVEKLTVMKK